MKLVLPVGAIVASVAACCCCGGDFTNFDPDALIEQLEEGSVAVDEGTADVGEATATTSGTCGRFKTDGFSVPAGLSVTACATMGDTESLVMQGSGNPEEICKPVKAWAESKGWQVSNEFSGGGTSSLIAKEGGKQLTVACTDMSGQTTMSLSISPSF